MVWACDAESVPLIGPGAPVAEPEFESVAVAVGPGLLSVGGGVAAESVAALVLVLALVSVAEFPEFVALGSAVAVCVSVLDPVGGGGGSWLFGFGSGGGLSALSSACMRLPRGSASIGVSTMRRDYDQAGTKLCTGPLTISLLDAVAPYPSFDITVSIERSPGMRLTMRAMPRFQQTSQDCDCKEDVCPHQLQYLSIQLLRVKFLPPVLSLLKRAT